MEETKAFLCSASDEFKSMRSLQETCKSKFSECKKAEDESVGLIQVCNGRPIPKAFVFSPPSVAPSPVGSAATLAPPSATSAGALVPSATSAANLFPSVTSAAAPVQSATAATAAPATTAAGRNAILY